eukprot:CAMPEP_0196770742 /NCGR_PEP_ID=MMETSP1104-20130614/1310_1 /TAXON_ID=33652 /ORGANISM="Cafeteria sp., Strain Caron Lab Isolate" /LENGTH=70 /DNA_ID=CAMNT_0042140857 /DNA_START=122 /DNA_END=331 /DNA_ORIENTATION=-
MTTHAIPTHGDSRSPILAAFQKIPVKPVLLLSSNRGALPCRKAQAQINSSTTVTKLEKSKSALMALRGRH